MHNHINKDNRAVIAAMLRQGYTQSDVARTVGVHRSSICREIARNSNKDGAYNVWYARRQTDMRRRESKTKYRKIENNQTLSVSIEEKLDPLVSPETIAHEVGIHHQTIYSWIYRSRSDLLHLLPQRGRKRRRYGSKRAKKQGWTRHVRSIHERADVSSVSWEGDTIKGKGSSRLLTHVERKSLFTRADLMQDGTADSVHATLKSKPLRGIITYDRGSEFALWQMIEKDTKVRIYFADAYSPWQRPKNENTNGRFRRVFPKRFDFSTITQADVECVVWKMNHTPRKSLSWQTPCLVYGGCCVSS